MRRTRASTHGAGCRVGEVPEALRVNSLCVIFFQFTKTCSRCSCNTPMHTAVESISIFFLLLFDAVCCLLRARPRPCRLSIIETYTLYSIMQTPALWVCYLWKRCGLRNFFF